MKVTELKSLNKDARPKPKRIEDRCGITKTANQYQKKENFTNRELNAADRQTNLLVDEIRAMKVALAEYQLKESKWRREDREWLEQKEAELMKKLHEFEEVTIKVLKFVRLSDTDSTRFLVARDLVAEMSKPSVASRRSIYGEGESTSRSVSEIHLTDSEIYQELKVADNEAFKTAGEIRAIKLAISEYHANKENCTWMKEDTEWLEERQNELMRKLAEFEAVTKRFLQFIGLADMSATQFAMPEASPQQADEVEETTPPPGNVNIHAQIKEADELACKAAEEIQEIKTEIANYQKQKEGSKTTKQDTKWLERKKSKLICKLEEFEQLTHKVKHLVGLAEMSASKSLPMLTRPTLAHEGFDQNHGGSWIMFVVEQIFYALNLFYYP